MARCLRSSTPSSPTCAGSTLWAKSSSLCLVCMPYMYAYMYALYVCLFSVGQVFLFVAGMPRAFFFFNERLCDYVRRRVQASLLVPVSLLLVLICVLVCVLMCVAVLQFQCVFFLSLYASLFVSLYVSLYVS